MTANYVLPLRRKIFPTLFFQTYSKIPSAGHLLKILTTVPFVPVLFQRCALYVACRRVWPNYRRKSTANAPSATVLSRWCHECLL